MSETEEGHIQRPTRYRWVVLACAWLLAFFIYSSLFIIPPILLNIMSELALGYAQASLVFTVPIILLVASLWPSGLLADRMGFRRTALIGVALSSTVVLLRGATQDYDSLLMLTALHGIGWGLVLPSLPKVVSVWFPKDSFARATGLYLTGATFGSAFALAAVIPIMEMLTLTWRQIFYLWGLIGVSCTFAWWLLAKEPQGINDEPSKPMEQLTKGVHALLLRSSRIWLTTITFFLVAVNFYTLSGWLPTFFVERGSDQATAAYLSSLMVFIELPMLLVIPSISDRVGLRKPFLIYPLVGRTLAAYALTLSPISLSWILVLITGLLNASLFVICLTLPVDLVEPKFVGSASGIVLSGGYAGGIVGPVVAGYLIDITGTAQTVLLLVAAISLATILPSILLPESGGKSRKRLLEPS